MEEKERLAELTDSGLSIELLNFYTGKDKNELEKLSSEELKDLLFGLICNYILFL